MRAPNERGYLLLLIPVLMLAALLRFWGLDFGLPHTLARPDETEIVTRSLRFLAWDLNPRFFHYPSLFFYVLGAVFAVWAGVLALLGQPLTETLAAASLDLSPYLLLGRAVSALAGITTVAALFALGRLLGGPRVGLAAALLLAVAPLHVRDSHFATTDVLLTLFVTLSVLFVLHSYRTGRRRDYALAGAFAGLAMGTKYVGLLMPCSITVAYLLSIDTTALSTPLARVKSVARDSRPWIFTGCWITAFLVTSPYVVLDNLLFMRHFLFQLDHLAGGHGLDLGTGGVYHLRYTLPLGVGWPAYLVAFAGAVLVIRERWREAAVLLSFPVIFYASTFTSQTLFLRYMMPVVPFVCLLAGFGSVRLAEMGSRPRARTGLALLLLVLAAEPLTRDVSMNRLLSQTDSRVLTSTWLEQSAGPGSYTVYQTGEEWGHLQLPRSEAYYLGVLESLRLPAITRARQVGRDYERFQAEIRRDTARVRGAGFEYIDSTSFEAGTRPDYVVVLESDLTQYSAIRSSVLNAVAAEYELIHHTRGTSPEAGGWYDQLDAFYLPFRGFADVERPGPDVTIYRRIETPWRDPLHP